MTVEFEQAVAYLGQDVAQNIHMLEALRHGSPEILGAQDHGVLLRQAQTLLLSADTVADAERLLSLAPEEPSELVVCRADVEQYVAQRYAFQERVPCIQASYQRKERLDVSADIRQLDMGYHALVLERYSLFHDPEYIADRIAAGVIFGAFVEGELAGFIGEHDEGSMGMLEVFPPFRRMGLGLALESFQINRIVSLGRVPYDHVIIGNDKSFHLQQKLGMTMSRDHVTFFNKRQHA